MATIPSTNVNLATNVRDILNAAGGSVNNNLITFFQTGAKLNKWSRKKPVRHPKLFDLTDAEFKSVNFGLSVPSGSGSAASAVAQEYIYQLPTGGTSQPYRLSDFKGYSTTAYAPCVNRMGDMKWNTIFQDPLVFSLDYYSGGTDTIGLDEVNSQIANCYFCVAIQWTRAGNTYLEYKTSASNIKNDNTKQLTWTRSELPFTYPAGQLSNLKYYLLACSTPKTTVGGAEVEHTFYSLPFSSTSEGVKPITFDDTLGMTFTPYGIADTPKASGFADFNYYTQGSGSRRYQLAGHGGFWLAYEIKNTSNVGRVLYGNLWKGEILPSPSSSGRDSTGYINLTCYNITSGTLGVPNPSTISIGAGQTVKLLLGSADWMDYVNGSLVQNMQNGNYDMRCTLLYNDATRQYTDYFYTTY